MDKNMKRAKRRHQTFRVMQKRLNQIKETCRDYYDEIIKKHREGHFRKSSAYDCGNPRCWLCHFDKLMGRRPIKEQPIEEKYEVKTEDPGDDWQRARVRDRRANLSLSMGI